MAITTIIYRAANVNMGDTSPDQADKYRTWALEQIQNEYPDADVSVEDSDRGSEVATDDGSYQDEEDALLLLSGLWDACPWDWDHYEELAKLVAEAAAHTADRSPAAGCHSMDNAMTTERAAELINNGGFEDYQTSEWMAAAYAYRAQAESGNEQSEAAWEYHLECAEEFADFDSVDALRILDGRDVWLNGRYRTYSTAVNAMDDTIREALHSAREWESNQQFMDAYCTVHEAVHGEDFDI